MKKQASYISVMNMKKVRIFLENNGLYSFFHRYKKFIFIEHTKPYDELTEKNTYILVSQLRENYGEHFMRILESSVVTHMIETRWTVEIKDEVPA